jgi:hypothetical protein
VRDVRPSVLVISRKTAHFIVTVATASSVTQFRSTSVHGRVPVPHVTTVQLTRRTTRALDTKLKKLNSVVVVLKRTIPTERPPLVGEVSANLCGWRVWRGQRNEVPWYSARCLLLHKQNSNIHLKNSIRYIRKEK